jgi:hypothetical protein
MGKLDRAERHRAVSAALASWSDEKLISAVAAGDRKAVGIGGSTASIDVNGVPVFVKLVRLTHLEAQPEHVRCTANLFDLPSWYQYGVGSVGFGAWRELRAHELATEWVLDGTCPNFPLLHHSRLLPDWPAAAPGDEGADDIEEAVRFWGNSPAVRRRLQALANASATLVLVTEYLPDTLHAGLTTKLAGDEVSATTACLRVEEQLLDAVRCMGTHQLSHFDAHFHNVLADDQRIYVADFGLAASRRFEITTAERQFLERTADHDLAYVVTQLVNTVVAALGVADGPAERNAYLRRCAREGEAPGLTTALAEVVRRYAPVATVINEFYWKLHDGKLTTPYPAEEISRTLDLVGLSGP